ncbi:MAG: alpha/beta hydrolase [Microbacterium sp.]
MHYLPSYVEEGEGEPLVLLMGLGAEGERWRPHVDAWAQHYRCIMIDNRGTGRSQDVEGPHTIGLLADDTARLMDHLGLSGVRVAGVSMGSAITQRLMIDRPDLVGRAVLIAPWSRVTPSVDITFDAIARAARGREASLLRRILHNVTWTFEWTDSHPDEAAAFVDDPTSLPFDTIEKQARACASFDVVDEIGAVRVPTLVTLGASDLIIHPHLSRQTARLVHGADLIEYPTGHVHHFEEADKFNHDVLEWIK